MNSAFLLGGGSGGGGYSPAAQPSGVLYVSPTGNDGSALRGHVDYPYATVYAAIQAASAGDTVYLLPGTHTVAQGQNLAKNGINLHIAAGATLSFTNTTAGRTAALFDEPTNAISMSIIGEGRLVVAQAAPGTWPSANHPSITTKRGKVVSFDHPDSKLVVKLREMVLFETNSETFTRDENAFTVGGYTSGGEPLVAAVDTLTTGSYLSVFTACGTARASVGRIVGGLFSSIVRGVNGRFYLSVDALGDVGNNVFHFVRASSGNNTAELLVSSRASARVSPGALYSVLETWGTGNIVRLYLDAPNLEASSLVTANGTFNQVLCRAKLRKQTGAISFPADIKTWCLAYQNTILTAAASTAAVTWPSGTSNKILELQDCLVITSGASSLLNSTGGAVTLRTRGANIAKEAVSGSFTTVGPALIVDAAAVDTDI